MKIEEVRDTLSPLGLESPDLEMLRPTEASYSCLLLQPSGPIIAGGKRIGSLDRDLSGRKAAEFLRLAKAKGSHLAVTPEYFLPWSALKWLVEEGVVPEPGALWVLGCESIRQEELAAFKAGVANACEVVYEPCDALPTDRPLLDPAVLLFATQRKEGGTRVIALVQFKTHPSRDNQFLEEGLLKRGKAVYRFRGSCGTLSAVAFICSDAFALTDELVGTLVDRSTLIHIQLNPDPRNGAYRQYRKTTFDIDARASECHILCLNWARTVVQHDEDGKTETWPAVGGSTWYCPESGCTHVDDIVLPNHELGLYYTYMRERRHALLLDYDEAVFELRVPKVITKGKAVLANRNGPNSVARYEWDAAGSSWAVQSEPRKAGFDQLLDGNAVAKTALEHLDKANALDIERLLALSAGAIVGGDKWYELKYIDSFGIDSDEVVRRVTVAQDSNDAAVKFRHARLEVIANVRHELDTRASWPPQIAGTTKEAQIRWDATSGHFNIRCADGKPGLICSLGDSPSQRELENVPSMLIDLLRRAGGPHQTRLCVFYRRFGEVKFAPLPGLTRFDDALSDERDILSVDPGEETEQA